MSKTAISTLSLLLLMLVSCGDTSNGARVMNSDTGNGQANSKDDGKQPWLHFVFDREASLAANPGGPEVPLTLTMTMKMRKNGAGEGSGEWEMTKNGEVASGTYESAGGSKIRMFETGQPTIEATFDRSERVTVHSRGGELVFKLKQDAGHTNDANRPPSEAPPAEITKFQLDLNATMAIPGNRDKILSAIAKKAQTEIEIEARHRKLEAWRAELSFEATQRFTNQTIYQTGGGRYTLRSWSNPFQDGETSETGTWSADAGLLNLEPSSGNSTNATIKGNRLSITLGPMELVFLGTE